MINQVSVFLQNEEGRLAALCRTLADANIDMMALTIAENKDYGLVRIICNDAEAAASVLEEHNFRAQVTQVSAIQVPNRPGGLADLLEKLEELDLNIEYGYCFSFGDEYAVDVLKIHDPEAAIAASDALEAAGFKALQPEDLQ